MVCDNCRYSIAQYGVVVKAEDAAVLPRVFSQRAMRAGRTGGWAAGRMVDMTRSVAVGALLLIVAGAAAAVAEEGGAPPAGRAESAQRLMMEKMRGKAHRIEESTAAMEERLRAKREQFRAKSDRLRERMTGAENRLREKEEQLKRRVRQLDEAVAPGSASRP